MTFLNTGRSGLALSFNTGSYSQPNGIEIGTGSSLKTIFTTGLTTPVLFRAFTQANDVSTAQQIVFTSDFTSTELSGLSIKELSVRTSGGNVWSADGFPSITFDGTVEMQSIVTWVLF